MKIYILFLYIFSQVDSQHIFWDNQRKLCWDDFKGNPLPSSTNCAATSYNVTYHISFKTDSVLLKVSCFFEKNNSWVKLDCKTDSLLKHEQGHFDLAEIFSRKLKQAFIGQKFTKKSSYAEIEKFCQNYINELNSIEDLYDRETEHSKNEKEQNKWNKKIEAQLKETKNYFIH